MALPWPSGAVLVLLAGSVVGSLEAQAMRELGVQAVVTAAEQAGFVVGPVAAIRPSSRIRVSLGAGIGASESRTLWRTELLGHFLLNPEARSGLGLYGAGGVAAVGGPVERGYLVLAAGVEARPGGRSGWMVEAGIGGGARVVAGYRWRWGR